MKYILSALVMMNMVQAATIRSEAETMMESADQKSRNSEILKEKLPSQVNALSMVDKIRSFDREGSQTTVTFWEDARVFRVSNENAIIPCLENSFKSDRPVTLAIDQKTQTISQCKMFGGTHPGMRRSSASGTGSGSRTNAD